MKPFLVVAATFQEVQPLHDALKAKPLRANLWVGKGFELLITGVGPVNTALALAPLLATARYERVLNLGVAGAYAPSLPVGEVVQVVRDALADLGAHTPSGFVPLWKMGFAAYDGIGGNTGQDGLLENPHPLPLALPQVQGATLAALSGTHSLAESLARRTGAQVETMEGAVVFQACLQHRQPFAGIRAISNRVGPREEGGWNLPLAIANLNRVALQLLGA